MKKTQFFSCFFLVGLVLLCRFVTQAQQVTTTINNNALQLAQIIAGPGVVVTNASAAESNAGMGEFDNGAAAINIQKGIILSNGDVTVPNGQGNILSTCPSGTNLGGGSDPDLQNEAPGEYISDVNTLEFDVFATTDIIQFHYVFASDEYPEFVSSDFNDIFGFFVSGPGIIGKRNIALVPNTNSAITINTINNGQNDAGPCENCQYYRSNQSAGCGYDGTTVVLSAEIRVLPCSTYTFKLAIGDQSDECIDSSVFIEENSLSNVNRGSDLPEVNGDPTRTVAVEGCDSVTFNFNLTSVLNTDYWFPIRIKGTAQNGIDYEFMQDSVLIAGGNSTGEITVKTLSDSLIEGLEDITVCLIDPCTDADFACQTIQIDELNASINPNQIICPGDSAQLTVNGEAGYTYQWVSDPSLACTNCFNPKAAPTAETTYTVSVSNAGCETVLTTKVSLLDTALPYLPDTMMCIGETTTEYDYSTPVFNQFTWSPITGGISNPNSANPEFTALDTSVTYTLVASRSNSSCQNTRRVNLGSYNSIAFEINKTDPSCFGQTDGSMGLVFDNSSEIGSILWETGSSDTSIVNLGDGTYGVEVTSIYGCNADTAITLTAPPLLVATGEQIFPAYCNDSSGQGNTVVGGGTGPFSYQWTPDGGNNKISSRTLSPGTYIVEVMDANACSDTAKVQISNSGNQKDARIKLFGPFCRSAEDYVMEALVDEGMWYINGSLSGNIFSPSSLGNGIHEVIHVVADGQCSDSDTLLVKVNDQIPATINPTARWCSLDTLAELTSVTQGGKWFGKGMQGNASDSLSANFLPNVAGPGSHTVYHLIEGSCGGLDSITIVVDTALVGAIQGNYLACPTGNMVPLVAVPSNGIWTGPGVIDTLFDPQQTGSGDFKVHYTPARTCVLADSAIISVVDTLNSDSSTVSLACYGDQNASISVTVSGEMQPYQYNWDAAPLNNTPVLDNVGAGEYAVTITDDLGCVIQSQHAVVQPDSLFEQHSGNVIDVRCNGFADGEIQVFPAGGTAPYTVSLTPTSGQIEDYRFTNLAAGDYEVTIQDHQNCQISKRYSVGEPQDIDITGVVDSAFCNQANGAVHSVQITGGTGPYNFLWNNSDTTINLNNVPPGSYTIFVTDANLCEDSAEFNIPNAGGPLASVLVQPTRCFNGNDGQAVALVTGGAEPYSYQWSGFSIDNDTINVLSAGDHMVTVSDANNCSMEVPFVIQEPEQIEVTPLPDTTLCAGQFLSFSIQAEGGVGAPYVFEVNHQEISGNHFIDSDAQPKSYAIVAKDTLGCNSDTVEFNLNYLPPISVQILPNNPVCPGDEVSLQASASGGTEDFTLTWSFGSTDNPVTFLTEENNPNQGGYVVCSDGCSMNDTAYYVLNFHEIPDVNINVSDFEGCAPHSVILDVSENLLQPVNWYFGDGTVVNSLRHVEHLFIDEGTYLVSLEGLSEDGCFVAANASAPIEVFGIPKAQILDYNKHLTTLNTTGDYALMSYRDIAHIYWRLFGSDSLIAAGNGEFFNHTFQEEPGDFWLHALFTSAQGCTDSTKILVQVKEDEIMFIPNSFTPNGDGLNDNFKIHWAGFEVANFKISVFNRWGEQIFSSHDPYFQWNGQYQNQDVKPGQYVYRIDINSLNGKRKMFQGQVVIIR